MIQAILLTFLSGVIGTFLGGLVSILFHFNSQKSLIRLLSFSAGMMISMICFDLLPEAIENGSLFIAVIGCACGVILLLIADHHFHHSSEGTESGNLHHHEHHLNTDEQMMKLGLLMIGSVALHNFPEGLAIGSSAYHELSTGILMAILLSVHNIPEGMGMIAPLLSGGMAKPKALLLVASSGLPTLLGGILGALIGGVSETIIAFTLAFAAGCMIYVTYYEILPQVQLQDTGKSPLLFQLAGFLLGLTLITLL